MNRRYENSNGRAGEDQEYAGDRGPMSDSYSEYERPRNQNMGQPRGRGGQRQMDNYGQRRMDGYDADQGDHGDHGDHEQKKHGSSGGHKAVNIILIIIIVLLVVAIVFCILYLTNAWKPPFMKTIFGDNEKFTHKGKIGSSCSEGVCGYGDKLNDDDDKKKRKRRSRKIKE